MKQSRCVFVFRLSPPPVFLTTNSPSLRGRVGMLRDHHDIQPGSGCLIKFNRLLVMSETAGGGVNGAPPPLTGQAPGPGGLQFVTYCTMIRYQLFWGIILWLKAKKSKQHNRVTTLSLMTETLKKSGSASEVESSAADACKIMVSADPTHVFQARQ